MLIGIDASRAVAAQRTGTENYSLYLVRALLEVGRKHRYRLYFNQPPPDDMFRCDERVEWRVIPFPRLWTHLRLAWEVAQHPPDLLFVPAHVLPLVHPKCCAATVHDLGYLYYPSAYTRSSLLYLDWSTRFNARSARRIIVDSKATRDDLIRCYKVAPGKIVVAHPAGVAGLTPVTDSQKLDAVRRRYETGSHYFLYVGTLQPRKNLITLLWAYASLIKKGDIPSEVNLVLAGRQGWLCRDILEVASAQILRDRVVFPGYIPSEDLAALLSGAIAYILPSWYEGFGLPVLEAMACGTPVVCSNVSSLPEVAGDAALLFDPRDAGALATAMSRVYREPALRRELIERGRERLKIFNWKQCAQTVLTALETVGAEMDEGC